MAAKVVGQAGGLCTELVPGRIWWRRFCACCEVLAVVPADKGSAETSSTSTTLVSVLVTSVIAAAHLFNGVREDRPLTSCRPRL